MSATAIANDLRAYAVKRWPTANHKFRKARLADLLGFTERRVRSYWEAKAASPRDDEIDTIQALIGAHEEATNAEADEALARRIDELEAQVAFLVQALASDALAAQSRTQDPTSRPPVAGRKSAPR